MCPSTVCSDRSHSIWMQHTQKKKNCTARRIQMSATFQFSWMDCVGFFYDITAPHSMSFWASSKILGWRKLCLCLLYTLHGIVCKNPNIIYDKQFLFLLLAGVSATATIFCFCSFFTTHTQLLCAFPLKTITSNCTDWSKIRFEFSVRLGSDDRGCCCWWCCCSMFLQYFVCVCHIAQ